MLRDAGVRTKLLAVLAIPTVLLVVVTGLLVQGQVVAARRAGQVNALTDVAIQVNRVVHSLQEERSATLGYLQNPASGNRASMQGQRQFTNQQLRLLRSLVASSPVDQMSTAVQEAVGRTTSGHNELAAARKSVDAGRFFATETDVFYSRIIRADLDLPGVIASSATSDLAQRLQGYEALSSAIEYSAHERDIVEIALLRGMLTEADFATSAALVAQQRQALADVQRNVPAVTYLRLDNALAGAENSQIDKVRRDLTDLLKGREPNFGRSVEWLGAANSRIGPMTDAENALVADIAQVAYDTQNQQEQRSLLLVLISVVGLGLALMLAVSLARRITRPLRRLTVAAGEIGDELPHMVERMQTPGEGPGVVVEPIPVESSDEIGRLAAAFNTVNDVTVAVAKEQAALRASIAEMFVNVARRNQVLLGRQLSQLDTMEAREEDPDVLDNLFKLDHLATRMRRNAESLLVLAGIDSTRRLRQGLPLSDVIRTAVGEIESFDRIDLSMSEDPEVSGRHALTVAHLLAELLENATHFSNPETRVVLAAAVKAHGVDVTVTDYGLGMSDDEVAEANAKIAHPPVAEIAVSQRLGLFVVGRLAARLGASVTLRRGRTAGTVVVVSLPTSVFEGMAAPEPVADEPVDAAVVSSDADLDDGASASVVEVVEVVEAVETVDALDVTEAVVDEPVSDDPSADVVQSSDRPRKRGFFGARRRKHAAEAPSADPDPQPFDATDDPAETVRVFLPEPVTEAVEPEPRAEEADVEAVEPEPVVEAAVPDAVAEVTADVEPDLAPPEAEDVEDLDVVEAEPVAEAVESGLAVPEAEEAEVAEVVEPEPVAEAAVPEVVAEVAVTVEPDPEPEPVAEVDEPEVQPAPPTVPFEYLPAVTILPSSSRPARSRRFGRNRGSDSVPSADPGAVNPVAASWPQPAAPDAEPVRTATAPDPVVPESHTTRSEPVVPEFRTTAPDPVAPEASLPVTPPADDGFAPPAPRAEPAAQEPGSAPQQAAFPVAPRRETTQVPAGVGAYLPSRTTGASPSGQAHAPDASDLDRAAAQAQLHSSALSELRGLYEPSFAPAAAGATGGLTRRTPKAAEPGTDDHETTEAPAPARSRDAAKVRGMLSGFRAGVERGRGSAQEPESDSPDPTS